MFVRAEAEEFHIFQNMNPEYEEENLHDVRVAYQNSKER